MSLYFSDSADSSEVDDEEIDIAGELMNGPAMITISILNFLTYRSGQTVQTQIRLLLEEQSNQGLHCLQFHLHLYEEIP